MVSNLSVADLETITLKGKWTNFVCEYNGSYLTDSFPSYAIFLADDSGGTRKYMNVTSSMDTSVEETKEKQYSLNIEFQYRVLGEFCDDHTIYIHVR